MEENDRCGGKITGVCVKKNNTCGGKNTSVCGGKKIGTHMCVEETGMERKGTRVERTGVERKKGVWWKNTSM